MPPPANFCRQCGRDLRLPADDAAACTVCRRSPCIDPLLEAMAMAEALRLANRTDDDRSIHIRRGRDWRRAFTQAQRRVELQHAAAWYRRMDRIFTVFCLAMLIITIALAPATCSVLSIPRIEPSDIFDHLNQEITP